MKPNQALIGLGILAGIVVGANQGHTLAQNVGWVNGPPVEVDPNWELRGRVLDAIPAAQKAQLEATTELSQAVRIMVLSTAHLKESVERMDDELRELSRGQ